MTFLLNGAAKAALIAWRIYCRAVRDEAAITYVEAVWQQHEKRKTLGGHTAPPCAACIELKPFEERADRAWVLYMEARARFEAASDA